MNATDLFNMAKETILEQGQHIPVLVLVWKDDMAVALFDGLPETTQEKQVLLFKTARKLTKKRTGKEIQAIHFVTEAWTSFCKVDEPRKYNAPSEDPDRKEVILVQTLTILDKQIKQTIRRAEMLRSADGKILDLLPHDEEVEVQSRLLPAALVGVVSVQFSDKELAGMMKRFAEVGEI